MKPSADPDNLFIKSDDLVLVTGASGFIGIRVVEALLKHGFQNVRCFVRPTSVSENLHAIQRKYRNNARIEIVTGNLLSRDDCGLATEGVRVIYHLAAGRGQKSFPDAFLNSVVITRNLLDSVGKSKYLKRFVSISSFAVYSNRHNPAGQLLDESGVIEDKPHLRGDAYTFAKVKQDQLVMDYGRKLGLPYVIVRPGVVYGPGNETITGRAGVLSFGFFLHLGGKNTIPFTYVDNCAEAIVLAGIKPGIEGEVFNVVDDDLPSSQRFLSLYKEKVKHFRSLYLPHFFSYLLCYAWEEYSQWSQGQLPPVFNRRAWYAYWKKTRYSNKKLKTRLGWTPKVSANEGLEAYFASCRRKLNHA